MTAKPTTVTQYLASLDPDRKKAIQAVRKVVKANLDPKVKEGIQYGMIGYFIPHSVYPDGYHCSPDQPLPFIGMASQKNHMAVYLFCIYGDEAEAAHKAVREVRLLFQDYAPIPAQKALLARRTGDARWNNLRPPFRAMGDDRRDALAASLEPYGMRF